MTRDQRLFALIQHMRDGRLHTAAELGRAMGVSTRTIWRDMAMMAATGLPVEGERGLGYILRPGFDLPPLMFTVDEAEAIALGMAMIERTGDRALEDAARAVLAKIAGAVPPPLRQALASGSLYAWGRGAPVPEGLDFADLRAAIRDEAKLRLDYRDAEGRATRRLVWPLALIHYPQSAVLVAWCELRQDLRNFRADRILASPRTGEHFKGQGDRLRALWIEGW